MRVIGRAATILSASSPMGIAVAFSVAVMCGCSESSSTAGGTSAPSDLDAACIDYPDAGQRVYPFVNDAAAGYRLPQCPPSCHPQPSNASTAPTSDQSLPSGPCSLEGEQCTALAAGWCPPCIADHGPGNGYVCECSHAQWRCVITSQGGASCPAPSCVPHDAGTDG